MIIASRKSNWGRPVKGARKTADWSSGLHLTYRGPFPVSPNIITMIQIELRVLRWSYIPTAGRYCSAE